MADFVTIFEMGPRDGLQNEKTLIPAAAKIALIDSLSASGLRKIEATSFVSPKWVPQLADAAEVMAGITRRDGVAYTVLTPNRQGFEAALAAKADEVAVFASASEGFSQKNINCSIAESLDRFGSVMERAKAMGIPVRGYVSCMTDCPYDGAIAPQNVLDVSRKLLALGCYEVAISDTIGAATPEKMVVLLDLLTSEIPAGKLAGHFHDTQGRALENIDCALGYGMRTFDSSVAGLGGCPYAPGAKGNVATEAVVRLLAARGFETGIDEARLAGAAALVRRILKEATARAPK